MADTELFSAESLRAIQEYHAGAAERAAMLKADWDRANRIEATWRKVAFYIQRKWPFHLLDLFQREAPFLKQLREAQHPAIPVLEDMYAGAKQEADKLRRRYPLRMEEACAAARLALAAESRHPRYLFENGFLQVSVDERKGVARLSTYEGKLGQVPADPEAVAEAVKREQSRLLERPFDAQTFLGKLRECYLALLREDGQPDGASIPIRHISRLLAKTQKGARSDEFVVDLSRLATQGCVQVDGRRLELQQTKDTDEGMLLPGMEGQGYVGYILFRGG